MSLSARAGRRVAMQPIRLGGMHKGLQSCVQRLLMFRAPASTSLRRGLAGAAPPCSLVCRHLRRRPLDGYALAVLLPRRALSTETTIGSSGASPGSPPPPPGFNADEAKKPLRRKEQQNVKPAAASTRPTAVDQAHPPESQTVPKDVATGVAKVPSTDSTDLTQMAMEKNNSAATSTGESVTESKKEEKKLTIMQKIKKELLHYWDGTKLLATEVRISTKLAVKMAAGYELSRREHRQVCNIVRNHDLFKCQMLTYCMV